MSRQYNMYNVQLSEFWKQRIGKETMHNAPYMFGDEEYPDDLVSEASYKSRGSVTTSRISVASTATRNKASAGSPSARARGPGCSPLLHTPLSTRGCPTDTD